MPYPCRENHEEGDEAGAHQTANDAVRSALHVPRGIERALKVDEQGGTADEQ